MYEPVKHVFILSLYRIICWNRPSASRHQFLVHITFQLRVPVLDVEFSKKASNHKRKFPVCSSLRPRTWEATKFASNLISYYVLKIHQTHLVTKVVTNCPSLQSFLPVTDVKMTLIRIYENYLAWPDRSFPVFL